MQQLVLVNEITNYPSILLMVNLVYS
jgi:hypothetical protein